MLVIGQARTFKGNGTPRVGQSLLQAGTECSTVRQACIGQILAEAGAMIVVGVRGPESVGQSLAQAAAVCSQAGTAGGPAHRAIRQILAQARTGAMIVMGVRGTKSVGQSLQAGTESSMCGKTDAVR